MIICNECNEIKPIENRDLGLCASCNKNRRDQVDEDLYPEVRSKFLAMCIRVEATCPITREPITMDSDIHHKKGRVGYADKWARDNDISLLIDVRFFLAVSRVGHSWIELNPKKARQMGLSMARNENPSTN